MLVDCVDGEVLSSLELSRLANGSRSLIVRQLVQRKTLMSLGYRILLWQHIQRLVTLLPSPAKRLPEPDLDGDSAGSSASVGTDASSNVKSSSSSEGRI